jgi:hypothetical protein
MAIADLEATTLDDAKSQAIKRAIRFISKPPVIVLYENNTAVARCVEAFEDGAGTWSEI